MSTKKRLVSDDLWAEIAPYLPPRNNPHPRGGGRKPKDDRLVFEAILFVLRFGCQWNTLSAAGIAPSSTVHDRFTKWTKAGLFHRLRDAGLLDREALRHVDWSWLSRDNGAERTALPPGISAKYSRIRQENSLRAHASGYRTQGQEADAKA